MKNNFILFIWALIISNLNSVQCQNNNSLNQFPKKVKTKIDNDIKSFFHDNLDKPLLNRKTKIIFIFKIDSIGQIHSSHILKSFDLTLNNQYKINSLIEEKIKIPSVLLSRYKKDFKNKEYIKIYYPLTIDVDSN